MAFELASRIEGFLSRGGIVFQKNQLIGQSSHVRWLCQDAEGTHTRTQARLYTQTHTHTRDMHLVKKEGKNETAKRIKPKRKKEKKIRRKKGIVTDLLLPPMARSIFHHVIAWQCLTGGSSAIDPCPFFWFSLSWNEKKRKKNVKRHWLFILNCPVVCLGYYTYYPGRSLYTNDNY